MTLQTNESVNMTDLAIRLEPHQLPPLSDTKPSFDQRYESSHPWRVRADSDKEPTETILSYHHIISVSLHRLHSPCSPRSSARGIDQLRYRKGDW